MTHKELCKKIQRKRLELKWEIDSILDEHLGEGEGQWHIVGGWDCEKSPIGLCIYNPFKDPAKDSCIFCGGPHERK